MKAAGTIRIGDGKKLGTVKPCSCPDKDARAFHTAMKARTFGLSGATLVSVVLDEPLIALVARTVAGKNVALIGNGFHVVELAADVLTDADVEASKKPDPMAGADVTKGPDMGLGPLVELLSAIVAFESERKGGPIPAEVSASIESKLDVDFEIPPSLTAFMDRLEVLVGRAEKLNGSPSPADPPAPAAAPSSPETPKV